MDLVAQASKSAGELVAPEWRGREPEHVLTIERAYCLAKRPGWASVAFVHDKVAHVFPDLLGNRIEAVDNRHSQLSAQALLTVANDADFLAGYSQEALYPIYPLVQQFLGMNDDQGGLLACSDDVQGHNGLSRTGWC